MAGYTISGTYVANCKCENICPCPVGEAPHSDDGTCQGVAVFHIADGGSGDVDLSNVDFALFNHFPGKLTDGNWKLGVVVDDSASEDQVNALQRVLSGEDGGPFADLAALISDFVGIERGSVSFTDGDNPSAGVSGSTDQFTFEPLLGADGNPTTVKNAMFGFSPEFKIGKASGHSDAFGISFDGNYAETGDFNFSSEAAAGGPKGR